MATLQRRRNPAMQPRWLVVISAVLVTALLAQVGHGAVIKRENSISEQELAKEELLATAKAEGGKDNEAIGEANRISSVKASNAETKAQKEESRDDGVTGEPFDAAEADVAATDAPIPTFQPSVDRYTSSYRDNGVAESESLRESNGDVFTTVDYEQRFDRLEMTTLAPSSAESAPKGMLKQDSARFDAKGVDLEDDAQEENEEQATVVNLDESNKEAVTDRLETTRYEIQEEKEAKSNKTGSAAQKRGKFLANPEEATVINSDVNDPNLSIPSTADVWALASMKDVDHAKKKNAEPKTSVKDAVNATSATKLLTDWMSFLANDIPNPSAEAEPSEGKEENKFVSVTANPPQNNMSIRRFDEGIETTTEENIDRSIDLNYPSGIGATGVSDNLYYEDFTTDLPDVLTTTPTVEVDSTVLPETNQKIQESVVMSATTELPRSDINTVPNEATYARKPATGGGISDLVSLAESTSVDENIIPITTEEIAANGAVQNPTTPAEEKDPVTVTEESVTKIIPLPVDAAVEKNQNVVESTVSPTDITSNSIEKQTGNKVVESNNLPEYAAVEPTGASGSAVDGVDATTNNNSNYLPESSSTSNNNKHGGGSQSSAANNDREEDGQQQLAQTESTRVLPVSETSTAAASTLALSTESGAAESASEAAMVTTTTTAATMTTAPVSSSPTVDPVALTPSVSETMASETKTKPVTTSTTPVPERIELETTRRTNGHQIMDEVNNTHTGSILGATTTSSDKSPEGSDVNAIIAITVSVIAVIALVLLVGFLYVMRKRQKQLSYGQRCQPVGLDAYSLDNVSVYNSVRRKNNNLRLSKRSYGNSAFEDPGLKFNNLSIQGLQTMMGNKMEIYEEFKEIPLITARVDEVPAGCEDKNRYANVVPLPETRVHLKQLNGDEKTEYINANYVRGPKDNVNYYIAAQAPMDNTIVDFWRMIWEQNSKVICMLTDLTENGIEKCAEYLPPSAVLDTNRVFGDFSVTLKNREVKDKYAVSTIHLSNAATNTWREITHFWYQWPEEGMPLDETSVIAMLLEIRSYLKMAMPEQEGTADDDTTSQDEKQKKIEELNNELTEKLDEEGGEKKANGVADKSKSLQRTQGPLTVHCSPGTGRTGTIIACDIALRSLEMKNRSVDVPQIVYYVRRGRASTIKTRDQYEFVYRCANTYAQKLMEPIAEN